jgi:hypothetical protein
MFPFELMRGNVRECTRARAFTPGAPPLDLDRFFLAARALATRALCFILLSDVFGTRALYFFLLHVFYVCFAYIDSYEISLFF